MALPGLRSTADMGSDGRPKNWREGIMLNEPRNKAPLFALTSAMRSEPTDDPEFNWWEEQLDLLVYTVNDGSGMTDSETTFIVDERADRLKAGDLLRFDRTGEVIRVTSITSATQFEAARGASNTTAAAIVDNDIAIYLGSAYREGAPKATGTSYNPTKNSNVTQIFRDPIEWTRTAIATRLRYTNDIRREDRRRALNKHSIGIERAFWLGKKYETIESGQPLRYTGGIMDFIPAANKVNVAGDIDADTLFSYFPQIFAYGSGEKLAYGSLAVLSWISQLVRKNTRMEFGPREKEYGMNVQRLFTPAGTLTLAEHPLFGQQGGFLSNGLVILDTADFRYRYIKDTTLLKDRGSPGDDGESEEYLTEAGLEYHHSSHHFYLYGITGAAADS